MSVEEPPLDNPDANESMDEPATNGPTELWPQEGSWA